MRMGANIRLYSAMNGGIAPHPSPLSPQARLGELASQRGRIRKRMRLERESRSQPLFGRPLSRLHPLADADTQSGKFAKAGLLGEGQGEGRFLVHRAIQPKLARMRVYRNPGQPQSPCRQLDTMESAFAGTAAGEWAPRLCHYCNARS